MRSCIWNCVHPQINHYWAADVLSMIVNHPRAGPDLVSEDKFVEVKNGVKPENWTFSNKQIKYGGYGVPCFLLGIVYTLDRPIEEIITFDTRRIESMIVRREANMVGWDYVLQLEKRVCKTDTYRYPRLPEFPPITAVREVKKGIINFRGNISPSLFRL